MMPSNGVQQVGEGATGRVVTDTGDPSRVIKRYRDPLSRERARDLESLVDFLERARPSVRAELLHAVAWPVELNPKGARLIRSRHAREHEIVSYAMSRAPENAFFVHPIHPDGDRMLLELQHVVNRPYWDRLLRNRSMGGRGASAAGSHEGTGTGRFIPTQVARSRRLLVAYEIHRVFSILHDNDLVYGDVSSKNVCITASGSPYAFLLDADSIVEVSRAREIERAETQDWRVDVSDPVAADRAKFALLLWRLLVEQPRAEPVRELVEVYDHEHGTAFSDVLPELWKTGSDAAWSLIPHALFDMPQSDQREWLDDSPRRRYASSLLSLAEDGCTVVTAELLDAAKAQCQLEERFARSTGVARRLLQRELFGDERTFEPDVYDETGIARVPRTERQLTDLLFRAQHEQLRRFVRDGKLGSLRDHGWVARSMGHALWIETREMDRLIASTVDASPDGVTLEVSWPATDLVNAVQIRVDIEGLAPVVLLAPRRGSTLFGRWHLQPMPPSTELSISLVPGYCHSEGMWFAARSDFVNEHRIITPRRVAVNEAATDRVGADAGIELVDPVVVGLERRRRRIQQTRRRLTRLAVIVVAVAILALAGRLLLHSETRSVLEPPPDAVLTGPVVLSAVTSASASPSGHLEFQVRHGDRWHVIARWRTTDGRLLRTIEDERGYGGGEFGMQAGRLVADTAKWHFVPTDQAAHPRPARALDMFGQADWESLRVVIHHPDGEDPRMCPRLRCWVMGPTHAQILDVPVWLPHEAVASARGIEP